MSLQEGDVLRELLDDEFTVVLDEKRSHRACAQDITDSHAILGGVSVRGV